MWVSNVMQKGFDSEPLQNEKYIKTKVKSCESKINTNFQDTGVPKESYYCIGLSVILTDFVFQMDKNYYPQVFLEGCKYVVKKT